MASHLNQVEIIFEITIKKQFAEFGLTRLRTDSTLSYWHSNSTHTIRRISIFSQSEKIRSCVFFTWLNIAWIIIKSRSTIGHCYDQNSVNQNIRLC